MTQIIHSLLVAMVVTCCGVVRGADSDEQERTIVVLGDSIAAGLGVDLDQAFPSVLEKLVEKAGYPFHVVNAGVSGDTTAGGSRRINWLLKRPMDVLIIELGGNDALRGISPETTAENLVSIIASARTKQPEVRIVLTGMQIHQNMGPEYTTEFKALFEKVAKKTDVFLVPFLLEGVGGDPELNQADQIHPNMEGHKIVAENLWKVLEPVLKSARASDR
jgi:acyl-CoA thioesterase-1